MRVYARGTSYNAKNFLRYLIEQAPFPIRSIQMDGSSKFRHEFEQACEKLDIPLYVLPQTTAKSPQHNGYIERANANALRFYPFYGGPLE